MFLPFVSMIAPSVCFRDFFLPWFQRFFFTLVELSRIMDDLIHEPKLESDSWDFCQVLLMPTNVKVAFLTWDYSPFSVCDILSS